MLKASDLINGLTLDALLSLVGGDICGGRLTGEWFRCGCPIHGGKDPNFSISQYPPFKWFCFSHGCHEMHRNNTGIGLIMALRGINYRDALHEVCFLLGFPPGLLHTDQSGDVSISEIEITREAEIQFFKILAKRNTHWGARVLSERRAQVDNQSTYTMSDVMRFAANGCEYFIGRGFAPETISEFLLGTDFNWKGKNGTRATIPIIDLNGELIGIQGRDVTGVHKKKYDFPPGKVYGNAVYNLRRAIMGSDYKGTLIVVEGCPSVWHLYQLGYRNVVATFGSDPGFVQYTTIARYCDQVIVIPDGDAAGNKMLNNMKNQCGKLVPVRGVPQDFQYEGFEPEHLTRGDLCDIVR